MKMVKELYTLRYDKVYKLWNVYYKDSLMASCESEQAGVNLVDKLNGGKEY